MRVVSKLCFILVGMIFIASACQAGWEPHVVRQLNGRAGQINLPARIQMVTENWKQLACAPYIVYMPEKSQLLMQVSSGPNYSINHTEFISSDDFGGTWSKPKPLHTDAEGKPDSGLGLCLTYLGNGKLITICNLLDQGQDSTGAMRWFSYDYGKTWGDTLPVPPRPDKGPWYFWDPALADRNPKTNKVLVAETGYGMVGNVSEGYIRFSLDEGRTWTKAIKVPEWRGVNEIALIRARNGNIIAACRTDNLGKFQNESLDHYSGLGVSILRDKTYAWSKLKMLYEWGRMHPSMILLPDGDIVMTYVARKGYPDTDDGYLQFGIEAVVSHDNGETWDLDHRYILAFWKGNTKGEYNWAASSQSTSSVLLPNGEILTAFSAGYRIPGSRDVELVRWSVNQGPINSDRNITDAPFDSDLRNLFDPNPSKEAGASRK